MLLLAALGNILFQIGVTMDKLKILVYGLLLIFISCTYSVKYQSDVRLDELITAKTKITVKTSKDKFGWLGEYLTGYSVHQTIIDDLKKNVFVNPVETEPDILSYVEVKDFSCINGFWSEEVNILISLRLFTPNQDLIKAYDFKSLKQGVNVYESKQPERFLREAMEKIKQDINRDRKEIVAAIEKKERLYEEPKEITKPSAITRPPKLTFNYSIVDENEDRILDGGEKISLKVTVQNQGEGTAKGVKVLLSGNSKALNYLGKEKYLGDIQPNTQKSATFEVVLPYQIELDEGNIVIKVTESQGFGALKEKELRVAMQPAKIERETKVISVLIDVDQPLAPSSFKRDDAYAVIIGITDYRSNKIPKVKYARRDAETVKEYLVNICGISEENIILLTDDKATIGDVTAYIEEWFGRNVSKNSFVFVYFAGHGTPNPESGDAYLVPYDGEPGFISKLYPLKRFYNSLEKLPTENIVVALDACFSGAGGRSVIEEGKRPLVAAKIPKTTKKVAVITASDADEISQDLDTKKHGLFTYYFLKGLRGEADTDGDNWITLGELYNYCKPKIATESRRLGYTQTIQVFPKPLGKKIDLKIGKVR